MHDLNESRDLFGSVGGFGHSECIFRRWILLSLARSRLWTTILLHSSHLHSSHLHSSHSLFLKAIEP